MGDTITINLTMGGLTYPITILRSEEEDMRRAAKWVDNRLNAYRERYKELSTERLLTMVAFHFSLERVKLEKRNDTEPYREKIKELTTLLEHKLKEA